MRVRGTMEVVPSIEVNVDTVYIRTNTARIETDDFKGWEYDEIQYRKDEYLELLQEQVATVEIIQSEVIDALAIIMGVTIGE